MVNLISFKMIVQVGEIKTNTASDPNLNLFFIFKPHIQIV